MTNKKGSGFVTRRQFTVGLGTVTLAAPFYARSSAAQETNRLVLPTYGGSYQDHLMEGFTKPFTEETGIEVVFSGVPDLARLKAQVISGRPEWDVFEGGGSWFPTGSAEGLFEPLDTSLIDAQYLQGKGDYALFYQYLCGIAWSSDFHSADAVPHTWKDFWDVEKFPGRRTLRNRVDMVLEIALVADGVDPAQLYPLDVERAFKSLERIKPAISKWAATTSELTTLVSTNEVDFGMNYTGRVKGAQESGIPLQLSLDQVVITNNYIGVVKGTPRVETAMKFVEFVMRPDRQAAFAGLDTDIPANTAALSLMSEESKNWLPSDVSSSVHIRTDDIWWAGRTEELQQRFLAFLMA